MVGVAVAVLEGTGTEFGSASEPAVAAVVVAVGLASLGLPGLLLSPLPCDSKSALEARLATGGDSFCTSPGPLRPPS